MIALILKGNFLKLYDSATGTGSFDLELLGFLPLSLMLDFFQFCNIILELFQLRGF